MFLEMPAADMDITERSRTPLAEPARTIVLSGSVSALFQVFANRLGVGADYTDRVSKILLAYAETLCPVTAFIFPAQVDSRAPQTAQDAMASAAIGCAMAHGYSV